MPRVTGPLTPTDLVNDVYPTHEDTYGKGGLVSVTNITTRNAIPNEKRKEGMLTYTAAESKYWKLGASPWAGDNTDWSEHTTGGGGTAFPILTVGSAGNGYTYETDGTEDEVQLQAAIDAVATAGVGSVFLPEPLYSIQTQINMKDKVLVTAAGTGATIQKEAGYGGYMLRNADLVNGNSFFTLNGITFDGNKANQTSGSALLDFKYITDSKFIDLVVKNGKSKGMEFQVGAHRNRVEGCQFIDNDSSGFDLDSSEDSPANTEVSTHNMVVRNHILRNGNFGLVIDEGAYNIASKNIISTNGNTGIFLDGVAGPAVANIVTDNIVIGNGTAATGNRFGIDVFQSSETIVTGNIIKDSFSRGIAISDANIGGQNQVVANYVYDSGEIGIRVHQSPGVVVSDNVISGSTQEGIELFVVANSSITGNRVFDNDSGDTGTYAGINMDKDSVSNVVTGNNCYNTVTGVGQTYGIEMNGTAGAVKYNIITNNILDKNKTGPLNDIGTSNTGNEIHSNTGTNLTHVRKHLKMKNVSGSQRSAGDTVSWGTAASGDEYVATVGRGDPMILGVVAETTPDGEYGLVQVEGKNTRLWVNGIEDIAVGDLITTYSSQLRGAKARNGELAFAIALEAYTGDDSSGQIDCLIIPPRVASTPMANLTHTTPVEYLSLTNASGSTRAAGDVVSWGTAENEYDTTVGRGDTRIVGVVAESTTNGATGLVQTSGRNTRLLVNGTEDIAIGDFITTYSSQYRGAKARNGELAFAIALEAYTGDDSSGIIDCVLIEPRIMGSTTTNLVDDLTPELGGDLDALGKDINNLANVYGNAGNVLRFYENRGSGVDGIEFYTKNSDGAYRRRMLMRRGASTTLIRHEYLSEWSLDSSNGAGNIAKVTPTKAEFFEPLEAQTLGGVEQTSEPGNPATGKFVMWQSNGTGAGDDGDIMMKIKDSGGALKIVTVVDFSAS